MNGYGRVRVSNRKKILTHVLTYETENGLRPEGMYLDHLCRVTECCNPNHLELVTHKENVRRGRVPRLQEHKTQCPKGHPYSGENLIQRNRRRICRKCANAASQAYHSSEIGRAKHAARERERRARIKDGK
ncbi:HNH endonuclease [Nocardia cyriacigeorgica]|nr:HNH endonuclease [Nocardia cyriacigeorgica]